MIMIIVINVLQVITCTHARDHHLSFVAESIWRECLVGSRFFLRRRTEQENASVLFSHILQPKSEFLILFFLSLLFLFRILWLLVLSAILRRLGRENKTCREAVKPWNREARKSREQSRRGLKKKPGSTEATQSSTAARCQQTSVSNKRFASCCIKAKVMLTAMRMIKTTTTT